MTLEGILDNLDHILIFSGAFLGAIKVDLHDREKTLVGHIVDILLGVLFGIGLGYIYNSPKLVMLTGAISALGAVIGSNLVDAVREITPKDLKLLLLKWLQK